jgi:AGZA family xanthine/uracil permease-like MFS transporter
VPRAGLLGSLAAVALALISFLPLRHIAEMPIIGMLALTIILFSLVAHRSLPGHLPGALVAVVIGTAVYYLLRGLGGDTIVPPLEQIETGGTLAAVPDAVTGWPWWEAVVRQALERMPLVLPFALATTVGGIDCTESAAVAGDEYDTRAILLTEGLATVAAGLAGGVIQNTPYIGQPAYKAMGGRAAYTLATGMFIGLAGWFGWVTLVFTLVPPAVLYPILVFVGLEITSQSFRATPPAHYPALAFAALPLLAYLGLIVLAPLPVPPHAAAGVQTLRCLGHGFIVTSLLWGAALAALLDGKLLGSAGYFLIAAACSLVGIIHSPLPDEMLAWPGQVVNELRSLVAQGKISATAMYQTPYHWSAAYVVAAMLLAVMHWTSGLERKPVPDADPETASADRDQP